MNPIEVDDAGDVYRAANPLPGITDYVLPGWDDDVEALAPTTGVPDPWWEDRPDGCGCYLREDADHGDVITPPPGGCRTHTPWAFPGFTLGQVSP